MPAPTIKWFEHANASDSLGTEITTLDIGTVDAGSYSSAKCIHAHFSASSPTVVSSMRFWNYDQSAASALTSSTITLRDGTTPWSMVATHQSALSAKNFGVASANYGVKLPYFPDTSLGGGLILSSFTTPGNSEYIWIGVKPNISAQSGSYTSWGVQVGYDYT